MTSRLGTILGRHMTNMQRERAEAPFAAERGERWWVSLLLWVAIGGVGYAALAVLW